MNGKAADFFLGKNKVMALSLGKSKSSEYKEGLYQVSKNITGNRGLFFTNTSKEDVLRTFDEFKEEHYPRSGFIATRNFYIEPGPLNQPFSMEPTLRKLGLPTKLKDGAIQLDTKVTVCQVGDTLTPEQCRILEYFEQKMAIMRILIHYHYSFQDHTFTKLREDTSSSSETEKLMTMDEDEKEKDPDENNDDITEET